MGAHGRVLVAEPALQRQHQVPPASHVIDQAPEQRVAGDIQRWHHDHLVRAQIFGFREDEIHAGIQTVKRAVQPAHLQLVSARVAPGHVAGRMRQQERHVIGPTARIVAVEQRHRMRRFQIDDARADALQLMRRSRHFGISPAGFQIVRQHALPVSLLPVVQRVPVPILHHVGAGRRHQIDILAQVAHHTAEIASANPSRWSAR